MASSTVAEEKSLLVIILDITPSLWGHRELKRAANDKQRAEKDKQRGVTSKTRSAGPTTLTEVRNSVLGFAGAYASLNRENCLVIICVSGDNCAIVYPRMAALEDMIREPAELGPKIDNRLLHDDLTLGIADLTRRTTSEMQLDLREERSTNIHTDGCAVAAGLSLALCCINRFAGAFGGGALGSSEKRREDDGVLAMMEGKEARQAAEEREMYRRQSGQLTPRVLILQASEDRTRDYNAIMNCTFAAIKGNIVIDGCFIPYDQAKNSIFLEQACDRTGGVYLAPAGAAQVGGALLEVMLSIFLAPIASRKHLNLPALAKVDFRAKCFVTGESVDIANVCNQCLSIFKERPRETCPTCGAAVKVFRRKIIESE